MEAIKKEGKDKIKMSKKDFQRLNGVPIEKAFVMLSYQVKNNCKVIGFLTDGQIVLRMEELNGSSLKYISFKQMKKELLNA